MARLLLVEDEVRLAEVVQHGLQDEGHCVDLAHDGVAGLAAVGTAPYDVVLLDLMLPELSGLGVCRRLRARGDAVPILVLTARDRPFDVALALDSGADDYLVKPFAFDELCARVRALLRRSTPTAEPRSASGPLALDPIAHRVWRDGAEIVLTALEFRILEQLARRPGAVLSKARLVETAWDEETSPESNAVEVHLANLRRKLDRGRSTPLLHTVRGVGYVLRLDPQ